MSTTRLEAFSDGVLAIIITIMVLEMKAPHETDFAALRGLIPVFATYVMSFVYVGIYWNNHHHLMHLAERVSGAALWANLHLLFWLSLIPFVTGWMGENHLAPLPTALYGVVLLMSALAWLLLQKSLLADTQVNVKLRQAVGRDLKGKTSFVAYAAAIGLAFTFPGLALAVYVAVGLMWLIPDRRFERQLRRE